MIKIKSKIKKLILQQVRGGKHLTKSIKCKHSWYGNTYGGFYVCPDLLNEKSIVYSFGIGEDISFDDAIIKNHQCSVYGFDPTPKSINWVKVKEVSPKFHFYEYGISNESGFVDFFLPKNPEYVSGSLVKQENVDTARKVRAEMKSIKDIANELSHNYIDVLKMDIEGSEYDVIDDILNSDIPITQILIEFHDRFFEDGRLKTKQSIQKLKEHGYQIFAISDSLEEISFISKNAL